MARLAAAAAAGSGIAARMLAGMEASPPEADAAAADAAVAASGAEAGAAGAAAPADGAAGTVGGPDAVAADAASPEVGGPESAADACAVPDLQQLLEQIDADQGGPGLQMSPEAAAAQAALDEEILNEITSRERARLRRKEQAEDAAAAANEAADVAEAAREAEANRLWSIDVAAARAAAPFTHGEWPNLAAAKAAFNKRRRSGTPVERPRADASWAAGSAVADATPANPGSGSLGVMPPPAAHDARAVALGLGCSEAEADEAAAAEEAREMAQEVPPIAVPKPLPVAALAPPPPPSHPGSSNDPVVAPSKPMPKLPATVAPNPYRDIRYPAAAAPPSPEFEAEFDAQMVQGRAARLADAWKNKQKSPPVPPKPKRDTPIPTADMMDAFIAGQRSMGKGKGPAGPFPQVWGNYQGKGKAKSADPFVGLDGRGYFRGRDASRDRDGFKRGRRTFYEREGPRTPKPCWICGDFYVCKSSAGDGAVHGYCSNVRCERSYANRLKQMPVRDAYAGDVPIVIEETQPADAEGVPMPPADAAAAPAADAGHSDTDVSVLSPASPVAQFAAAANAVNASNANDAFQRWLNQQPAVVAYVARNRSGMPAQLWAGLGTTSCGKAPP